jgi:hypothetical protein
MYHMTSLPTVRRIRLTNCIIRKRQNWQRLTRIFSFASFGHVTHICEHIPQDVGTCTRNSADSKQASTYKFDVHVTVHRDKFLIINQLDALISQIYFRNETLNVSYSFSAHHQEFFTCKQDQDGTAIPSWSCSQAVSKPPWHIPLLCVPWKTTDDGQRNCQKHEKFHSKNKFEKLLHLVCLL